MDIVRLATTSALAGVFVSIGGLVAGCGWVSGGIQGSSDKAGSRDQVVEVYAASSLTDVYTELEQRYEELHPEVDIRLNLAGSSTLARQINDGAPADIFAPADESVLEQLDLGRDQSNRGMKPYATNRIVLVVPADNPKSIATIADLARNDVLTAKCIAGVPCGDATNKALADADIVLARSTDETNVRSVLAKAIAGEVDAAFVYQTDAEVSSEVVQVGTFDSPEVRLVVLDLNAPANDDSVSGNPPLKQSAAFAAYVRSEEASIVFDNAGFGQP